MTAPMAVSIKRYGLRVCPSISLSVYLPVKVKSGNRQDDRIGRYLGYLHFKANPEPEVLVPDCSCAVKRPSSPLLRPITALGSYEK